MKKHKFKILTFVAVAAALAGTGCFKSIGYETFYVLRPWAQEGTVKTPIPREDMLAYAFDADTTEWSVLSYEDAVAGIITSRRTGEKLRPIASICRGFFRWKSGKCAGSGRTGKNSDGNTALKK